MGAEVPLCLRIAAVLGQTCGNGGDQRGETMTTCPCEKKPKASSGATECLLTDLDSVRADFEDAHRATDERSDGFEVQAPDAPGSIHQQDDVGLSSGPAFFVYRDEPQKKVRKTL